ncbi:MAG: phosphate acyltransferase [Thermoleophilaceae bacterium]|nr:phosphate acyltransferase [Thermoleophilaceae bacterium]
MIALDAHGADGGPGVVAAGARLAGIPVRAFGPASELADMPAGSEVVEAAAIPSEGEPALAVRANPGSSVVQAAMAVGAGEAQALVSAGATGAVLAASVFHIKRIRGVHRPAIAALLPLPAGRVLLLDAGANAEVRPEYLVQFAHMGAAFMEAVHGVERPRVGLLSVGEEPGKGTADVIEAHQKISEGPLNFVGNVEGNTLVQGAADVVVTDGFTGNVALKTMEGTAKVVTGAVRDAIRSGLVSSLGGLLAKGRLGAIREQLDPNAVGGAILLGLRRPVVIAHGGSSSRGIAQALKVARSAVDEEVVERTLQALSDAGALRSVPAGSVAER